MEIRSATWHYTDAKIVVVNGVLGLGVVRDNEPILVQRVSYHLATMIFNKEFKDNKLYQIVIVRE